MDVELRPARQSPPAPEDVEDIDQEINSWCDYPIDDLLIRTESRTIHDVVRRIKKKDYIMNPEFQRDFIWSESKQSKLVESVIMRIPLPVFYMAEDRQGRMVVVDGLQRLTTFWRFLQGELALRLPEREELNNKRFHELPRKFQNRIEDCNLILYAIDSRVHERTRLDIFERVNLGEPLTRQQMRNSLFVGPATLFLREESRTQIFVSATGSSLNTKTMRDREFVNRFCAFKVLGADEYNGDMDDFLARSLERMNHMEASELNQLSCRFRLGLRNNLTLFDKHAFRRSMSEGENRTPLNASLWDVMSTGLSSFSELSVSSSSNLLQESVYKLLKNKEFITAMTYGPNNPTSVTARFKLVRETFKEIFGDYPN